MPRLNWPRLFLGTLIAAVIMFLSDGLLQDRLLNADWRSVYANLGANEPRHDTLGLVYFAIFELGRAFTAIFSMH